MLSTKRDRTRGQIAPSVVVISAPAKGADLPLHDHAFVGDGEVQALTTYLGCLLVAQSIAGCHLAHLERLLGPRRSAAEAKPAGETVEQNSPAKLPAAHAG